MATAFFIHMSIPTISEKYKAAKANWQSAKSEYNDTLDQLKELNAQLYYGNITQEDFTAHQQIIYVKYIRINAKKNELHKVASEIRKEDQFLQFKSFQYFLGELGWAVGLFLYAFTNLLHAFYVRNRYFKKEFLSRILLHSTLLFVGCFYTVYVFYTKDDFSRTAYFVAMLVCTAALVVAGKLLVDAYAKMTQYLRDQIYDLVAFIFSIHKKHYRSMAVKARYAEQMRVVLKEDDKTVKERIEEFEEEIYETIDKVRV
ncbi:MAG: hypothetical protein AAF934_07765 [Bacteroidota bacterium]